ncbi:hypothetical protein OG552_25115 [Streptomyces sp. NBC_01476]|nr:hypothetical protein [Streptomyces sp. NBC_01476]
MGGYTYAGDNPATYSDPTGRMLYDPDTGAEGANGAQLQQNVNRITIDEAIARATVAARAADEAYDSESNHVLKAQVDAEFGRTGLAKDELKAAKAQQQLYLKNAEKVRDAFRTALQDMVDSEELSKTSLKKISVLTTAWNKKNGKVYIGIKRAEDTRVGWYAEDDCAEQAKNDEVKTKDLQFVNAYRPFKDKLMPICENCQADYNINQRAFSGAKFDPGPWDNEERDLGVLQEQVLTAQEEAQGLAFGLSEALEDE